MLGSRLEAGGEPHEPAPGRPNRVARKKKPAEINHVEAIVQVQVFSPFLRLMTWAPTLAVTLYPLLR
jgi:hypothetical protein